MTPTSKDILKCLIVAGAAAAMWLGILCAVIFLAR